MLEKGPLVQGSCACKPVDWVSSEESKKRISEELIAWEPTHMMHDRCLDIISRNILNGAAVHCSLASHAVPSDSHAWGKVDQRGDWTDSRPLQDLELLKIKMAETVRIVRQARLIVVAAFVAGPRGANDVAKRGHLV